MSYEDPQFTFNENHILSSFFLQNLQIDSLQNPEISFARISQIKLV